MELLLQERRNLVRTIWIVSVFSAVVVILLVAAFIQSFIILPGLPHKHRLYGEIGYASEIHGCVAHGTCGFDRFHLMRSELSRPHFKTGEGTGGFRSCSDVRRKFHRQHDGINFNKPWTERIYFYLYY